MQVENFRGRGGAPVVARAVDAEVAPTPKTVVLTSRFQATDDYSGALATLEEGARVGEELVRTKPTRDVRLYLCRCDSSMASNLVDMSRAEDALKAELRATEILQKLVDDDPRDLEAKNSLANSHFTRSYVLSLYLNKPGDSLKALELARKMENELVAADPERQEYKRVLCEIDSNLGVTRLQQGEPNLAFAVLEEGRETIEKLVAAEPNVTLFQTLHGEILGNLRVCPGSFPEKKDGG